MNSTRIHKACIKAGLIAILIFVGLHYEDQWWGETYRRFWDDLYAEIGYWLYWSGVTLLALVITLGRSGRALVSYIRFQSRVKSALPGLGNDRNTLLKAALAIHREQEERAIAHLESVGANAHADVQAAARWLGALAGVRFLKRHRRLLSGYRERFPQIHGLFFSHGRVPLRRAMLMRELDEVRGVDLDALLQSDVELIDKMIESIGDPSAPFNAEAEEVLEFITGWTFVFGAKERFTSWWAKHRPMLIRGGGPLLAGVRLVQRELYAESLHLLQRLGQDGLLSASTESVGRMAAFFVMLARPQWRLTSEDLPRFFRDVFYHGCLEMGVLRYPAAELPEVVEGCKRGRDLRAQKVTFIEDAFKLWEEFGEELAGPVAVLLKRLLNHSGRQCPARISYWRKQWARKQDGFEESVVRVMEGIAAVSAGDREKAQHAFEQAMELDPSSSTPMVNQVYLMLTDGREVEARKMARAIVKRYQDDGGAFVSLGRMFATHLEDTETAEGLFRRARELDRNAIEPLICLGEVKLMEGKYNESQAYFDAAKDLDPSSPEAKLGLARTYMETKRYKLAIDNLQPVAREGRGDAQHFAHYLLYRSYRDMSDHQSAIEYLDKVPTPFFKEPDILDDIAFHLESEQHYAKARVFSERAMVLRAGRHELGEGMEPMEEI